MNWLFLSAAVLAVLARGCWHVSGMTRNFFVGVTTLALTLVFTIGAVAAGAMGLAGVIWQAI